MSLTENALLTGAWRENWSTRGFIDWGKARGVCRAGHRTLRRAHARAACGRAGAVGRQPAEIRHRARDPAAPRVLVVNQPTWGVDAAAAAAIRQALMDLAQGGAAVVVISQDLDELLEIADRFAALNGGRLTASPRRCGADDGPDRPDAGRRMDGGGSDAAA
jgi:general nucleoside transport system ATP-binding protein